jgi:hypothetical protein
MYWQGRDDNFVILHRGGVLELGATRICQRVFIPVRNFIKDFCENYELATLGGTMSWEVRRPQENTSGQAATEFTLLSREYAQDKKASVKLSIGSLDHTPTPPNGQKPFVELMIGAQKIDPSNGKIDGREEFALRIDKVGNSYMLQAGNRTEEVKGNYNLTVTGNYQQAVAGSSTISTVGTKDETIGGAHTITGSTSAETWSGAKSIGAATLRLGSSGAGQPVVLGKDLINWLANHSHPGNNLPPTQSGGVNALVSKKVFVE